MAANHKTTEAEDDARIAQLREEDLAAKEMALADAREEYEGLCEAMAAVALTRAEVLEEDAKKTARKAQRLIARKQLQQEQEQEGDNTDPRLEETDTETTPIVPSQQQQHQQFSAAGVVGERRISHPFDPIYEEEEDDDLREEEDLEYLQTIHDFKTAKVCTNSPPYSQCQHH